MEVTKAIRQFKYNGVALQDPGPNYTLEQVREFYATLYPEIVNAQIEGPEMVGSKTVYEFRRAVGTKGDRQEARARLEHAVLTNSPLRNPLSYAYDLDAQQPLAKLFEAVLPQRSEDRERAAPTAPSELLAPLP